MASAFFEEWTQQNATRQQARTRRVDARPVQPPAPRSPHRRPVAIALAGLVGLAVGTVILTGVSASADPSASTWQRLRVCESGDNYSIDTGNDHYGAYQFDLPTWRSVGGTGYPNRASKAEQDYRALILYRERGWEPWQCATILGLRSDRDAASGRISDLRLPTASGTTTSAARIPAFPGGSHWYTYGDWNSHIKAFQDQMHRRGFFPVGTGQYGPNTLRMVKQLQRLNGLVPNGLIGPNTWRMAWTGVYSTNPAAPTPHIPAFPGGSHWYTYGDWNSHIKAFQDEMHRRGFFPVGTGQYGPNTLRMVKRLQQLNGLVPNGYLGPNTWKLAWVGRY